MFKEEDTYQAQRKNHFVESAEQQLAVLCSSWPSSVMRSINFKGW